MPAGDRTARRAVMGWCTVFAAIVAFYAIRQALRVDFTPGRIPRGVLFGSDSLAYREAAHAPVWSWRFLAAPGPFGFLLVAKLCLRNVRAVVLVHGLAWTAAWIFCARVVTRRLGTPLARGIGWAAILSMALAPELLQWIAAFSTESLSMSALVATIAILVRFVDGPTVRGAYAVAGACAVLAFLRDTNVILLAIGAVACAALALLRPRLRAAIGVVAAACVVFAATAAALSNRAERWYYPLQETMVMRLQVDAEAHRYLTAHGFPDSPQVAALSNPVVYLAEHIRIDTAPEYGALRSWLRRDGRSVYTRFLVTHPRYVLSLPWHHRNDLLAPHVIPPPVVAISPPEITSALSWPGFPTKYHLIELWLILACVAAGALLLRARDIATRRWLVVVLVIGGLWLPHALLAFHGDALENARHELTAALQLRMTLWLVTLATIDWIGRRPASVAPGEQIPCES